MSEPAVPETPETPDAFNYAKFVWHYVVREGSVIRRAPLSFVIAMLVVGAPIYWFASGHIRDEYTSQIDDFRAANQKLDATVRSLQATIEFQDHKLAGFVGSPSPAPAGGAARLQYATAIRLAPQFPVKINVVFSNKGNSAAKGIIFGGQAIPTNNQLGNVELDNEFSKIRSDLKDAESRDVQTEIQSGDTVFNTITAKDVGQQQVESIDQGHGFLYAFAVMEYKDESVPPGKYRVTEVCIIGAHGSADGLCPTHNRIFISD